MKKKYGSVVIEGTREQLTALDNAYANAQNGITTLADIQVLLDTVKANPGVSFNINTLTINNTAELSISRLQDLADAGITVGQIRIPKMEERPDRDDYYPVEEYRQIKEKMDELIRGIDDGLSEREKVCEVYARIIKAFTYDTPAAYPSNSAEQEYYAKNLKDARSLKNALLEGKTVCAGYAEVLRNACAEMGIESQYVSGAIREEIPLSKLNTPAYATANVISKNIIKGTAVVEYYHAWTKVKIDGVWYNFDASTDSQRIKSGKEINNAFKADEYFTKTVGVVDVEGPKCDTVVPEETVQEYFKGKVTPTLEPNPKQQEEKTEFVWFKRIREFFARIREKIREFFRDLHDVFVPEEVVSQVQGKVQYAAGRPSWDLEEYGMNRKQLEENTRKTIEQYLRDNERLLHDEQEKNRYNS